MTSTESHAPEFVGDMTFEPIASPPHSTREDWMARAGGEYGASRIAAVYLNMSDKELWDHVQEYGDTDDEIGDAIVELAEWFQGWAVYHKTGHEVMQAVFARLVVIGERLCGKEAMGGTDDEED